MIALHGTMLTWLINNFYIYNYKGITLAENSRQSFVYIIRKVRRYGCKDKKYPPEGINQKDFRKRVKTWAKLADLHGIDALRHPTTCTEYTAEKRYNLAARVLAGESQKVLLLVQELMIANCLNGLNSIKYMASHEMENVTFHRF